MSVLLVAPPGIRRNSLLSLLRAQIESECIRLADDMHAAEASLLAAGARVLIADTALSQAVVLDLIESVRKIAPAAHVIALTDGSEGVETLLAAGAAKVLYRGILDEDLLHAALKLSGSTSLHGVTGDR